MCCFSVHVLSHTLSPLWMLWWVTCDVLSRHKMPVQNQVARTLLWINLPIMCAFCKPIVPDVVRGVTLSLYSLRTFFQWTCKKQVPTSLLHCSAVYVTPLVLSVFRSFFSSFFSLLPYYISYEYDHCSIITQTMRTCCRTCLKYLVHNNISILSVLVH